METAEWGQEPVEEEGGEDEEEAMGNEGGRKGPQNTQGQVNRLSIP